MKNNKSFIQKMISLILMSIMMMTSIAGSYANQEEQREENYKINLTDVSQRDWFYEDVVRLINKGAISGYSDGTFKPEDKISFAEFLKIATQVTINEKIEEVSENQNHWASNIHKNAVDLGIITQQEFPNDRDVLNKTISREDMALISVRIDRLIKGQENEEDQELSHIKEKILDYEEISEDRVDYVLSAYKKELISGKGNNFDPKGNTTRAEASKVIVKLLEDNKEKQEINQEELEELEEMEDTEDIKEVIEKQENFEDRRIPYVYGTGSYQFNPGEAISKEEAYILFLRVVEIIETNQSPLRYPTYKVIEKLENRNIFISNTAKLSLKDKITRAEIANMVDQYLNLSSIYNGDSIARVLKHSIMSLDKNGEFNPNKNISRAEIITVLNNIQGRYFDKANISDIPQIYKDLPKSHWAYAEVLGATIDHTINTSNQKWIKYSLTDSDKKNINLTSKHNETVNTLVKNGVSKPNSKQIKAIEKMEAYIENNYRVKQDFNNGKNLIFAFEGAGDYSNKWNKTPYHNEGRYGAMYIIIKNKQIKYITTNGSTLPDNPMETIDINGRGVIRRVRTLDSQRENISNYRSGNHNNYPGLRSYNLVSYTENKTRKVKSLDGRDSNGSSMNIHSGRSIETTMSHGCLTIRDTDYIKFAKILGYMPSWIDDSKNNFNYISKIGRGKFVPGITATLILDRTLMDQATKDKFWSR